MAETTSTAPAPEPALRGGALARWILLGLAPVVLLAAVLVLIVATNAGLNERVAPPIEVLKVERVVLPEPGQIRLTVVNDGLDPITIAQVRVDDAFWMYEIAPGRDIPRLGTATITIPYPWVEGEAHAITLITRNGIVFTAEVPVAIESPRADGSTFWQFALIGIYVGVVPVGLGLLWYPFMRRLGARGLRFILALTVGLLLFLIVSMYLEANTIALTAPAAWNGPILVPLVALLAFLLLMVIGNHQGATSRRGLPLAYRIALGIGLHNMGEGLAIGAAFALGEVALGVFLVIGFTLHNVTEGVGIAAPILRDRPALLHFPLLALLAGGPAVLGVWIGGFIASPLWTTLFLAVGIGAIAQVIVEVGRLIAGGRTTRDARTPALDWTTLAGIAAGIAIMYITALAVAA